MSKKNDYIKFVKKHIGLKAGLENQVWMGYQGFVVINRLDFFNEKRTKQLKAF